MKLYATTTSERASKGQGGNDFLEINITDENGRNIYHLSILPLFNGDVAFLPSDSTPYFIKKQGGGYLADKDQHQVLVQMLARRKSKGKRQKGECQHQWRKTDGGNYWCSKCDAVKDNDGGIIKA